jgi:urea carboxylase
MSPDFFTEEYADILFCSGWKVHHDSNRLGIRLIGPVPVWARDNGGEAGLHPSNIHDTVYAIGSLNFTGDMPVILTCDGPSLGGFVCPLTIIKADLWKVGQAKPGDNIRFKPVSFEEASKLEVIQNKAISELRSRPANITSSNFFSIEKEALYRSVIHTLDREPGCPKVVYRQAGDRNLLLEYGSDDFDITDRFRIHALMKRLKASSSRGILELSPGVRSLQIRYDNKIIEQDKLLDLLVSLESELVDINKMRIDSRIIRLPLAFEDSTTLSAVERYKETIRSTAPWLPNNVDFIQRINGLNHRDEVKKTVFRANYIVLGLGDVYLGAPCALATDPRDRLLTSKYNPARTFTAEGAVGIGGVYMCIYGMNSPGGYQLVGRTLPIWSKFINNPAFVAEQPWLLRLFDQIRFYPVSEEELERMRADFRVGDKIIRIEETEFDLFRYLGFLEEQKESISQFRRKQQIAFHEEVAKWKFYQNYSESLSNKDLIDDADIQGLHVTADINGSIWKILVREGQYVEPAMPIVVLEAMKTEITIYSPVKGVVHTVVREERQVVSAGETILIIVSE